MRELIGIILLMFFVWLHYRRIYQQEIKYYYFPALILKILAGLCVGLLYKYYYTGGDTWNYFYQAEIFEKIALHDWNNFSNLVFHSKYQIIDGFAYINQPRAALMVKLVFIVNLITNTNYWITSTYFSFFSFIGVWAFSSWVYKSFNYGKLAALALFIWPSFVFWSSGILKEALAVGLILWIISTFFLMMDSKSYQKVLPLLVATYFLFLIKYYFAVIVIVVLLVYVIAEMSPFHKKSYLYRTISWVLILFAGMIVGGFLHPNLEVLSFMSVIIKNNEAFVALSTEASVIHYIDTSSVWVWHLINSPKALFASIFMPLSLNRESVVYSMLAIENWVLLVFILRGAYIIKKSSLMPKFNMMLAAVSYIVMLSVFLALSTPNLGTLSRYKVAFIPVLLVMVFIANKIELRSKKLRGS